jgi:hypothetical protein
MQELEKIFQNLPEVNPGDMKVEAQAFIGLLHSKHYEYLYISLIVFLIFMLALFYFQFFKDKSALAVTFVKKWRIRFIIIAIVASWLIWLFGNFFLHTQINNFFNSNVNPDKANFFNDVAPNLPNCRYYLFCNKAPADKYRLSLTRLKSDILPIGYDDIEEPTLKTLTDREDIVKRQFVKYSYYKAIWPSLIIIIIFEVVILALFRIFRLKYR